MSTARRQDELPSRKFSIPVFQVPDESSEGDVETKLGRLANKLDEMVDLLNEQKKS